MSDTAFEISGDFEELLDPVTGRCLGTRNVPHEDGREYGFRGRRMADFTSPVEVLRGPNLFTLPASRQKPLSVVTMVQRNCGRALWVHPLDRVNG